MRSLTSRRFAAQGPIGRAFLAGGAGKLVAALCQAASMGFATRSLGLEQFGLLALLLGSLGLFAFVDLGIGNAAVTRLSALIKLGDENGARTALCSGISALAVISVTLTSLLLAVVWLIPEGSLPHSQGVSSHAVRVVLSVYVISIGVAVVTSMGARLALALERGAMNSLVLTLSSIATLLLCLVGWRNGYDVVFFAVALVAIGPLAAAAQFFWILVANPFLRESWQFNWTELKAFVRAGVPYFFISVGAIATYQTDSLVIQYQLGSAALAVFGVTTKLFALVTTMYAGGLQQIWASLAGALALDDLPRAREIFRRGLTAIVVTGLPVAVVLVLAGPTIIRLWVGEDYVPDTLLLVAVGTWSFYSLIMNLVSFLLNAANVVTLQATLAILMAIASIPLSIYWAEHIGVSGPVLASLVCHGLIVAIPCVVTVSRILSGDRKTGPRRPQISTPAQR